MAAYSAEPENSLHRDDAIPARRLARSATGRCRFVCTLGFFAGVFIVGSIINYVEIYVLGHSDQVWGSKQANFELGTLAVGFLGVAGNLIFAVPAVIYSYWRGRHRFSHLNCASLAVAAGMGCVLLVLLLHYLAWSPSISLPCQLLAPALLGFLYTLIVQEPWTDLPLCPKCGYLLYYADERRCPECGRGFSLNEINMKNAVADGNGVLRPMSEAMGRKPVEPT